MQQPTTNNNNNYYYYTRLTYIHTYIQIYIAPKIVRTNLRPLFMSTTWVRQYQKGKTSLDLNEARDDGVLACSGISWTICKQSAPRSRQITTPTSHHSIFFQARCSSWHPTNSVKALKADGKDRQTRVKQINPRHISELTDSVSPISSLALSASGSRPVSFGSSTSGSCRRGFICNFCFTACTHRQGRR